MTAEVGGVQTVLEVLRQGEQKGKTKATSDVEEFSEEPTSHLQRPIAGFPCNHGLASLHWFEILLLTEVKLFVS
jgi:hypothetical protein